MRQLNTYRTDHRPGRAASPLPASGKGRLRHLLAGTTAAAIAVIGLAAAPAAADEDQQAYIVVLKDTVQDVDATASDHGKKYAVSSSHTYKYALKGYSGTMTPAEAEHLRADPAVDFVSAGRTFELPPPTAPAEPQVAPAWWQRVGGDPDHAWKGTEAQGSTNGVNTAVIDGGIDGTHPDLNVRGGVDCSSGTAVPEAPVDFHGHGTGVAGIIGAKDNGLGIVGTLPGTPLWSARVFGEGVTNTPDSVVICGIDWVTSTRMDADPHNDIQVANMSLGGPGEDTPDCGKGIDPMHLAICRSVEAGVTYVVAAGNQGLDFARTVPAAYDEVITATAMADFDGLPGSKVQPQCFGNPTTAYGFDDEAAPFSNFATLKEDRRRTVAAPGVCMLTTAPGGGLLAWAGTSQASPVVAGSVALCIATHECPGNPSDVKEEFLEETEEYNLEHQKYGYLGDPLRPLAGRYYGYLVQTLDY